MYNTKHFVITALLGIASLFLLSSSAFAHVIVTPSQVGIANTVDFTVSVPNEKDNPVSGIRLLIPKGVTDVSPNATSGWNITIKSQGSGDAAVVSEVDWSNGTIPVGEREEFNFQAQVPPTPTTLAWKAYQTYSDGTVVAWDINPAKVANLSDAQQDALADKENKGDYSTTQVINDLTADQQPTVQTSDPTTLLIAVLAFILGATALALELKKKK